jgi:hypothetical protein
VIRLWPCGSAVKKRQIGNQWPVPGISIALLHSRGSEGVAEPPCVSMRMQYRFHWDGPLSIQRHALGTRATPLGETLMNLLS